jgi:hypothetical protein
VIFTNRFDIDYLSLFLKKQISAFAQINNEN